MLARQLNVAHYPLTRLPLSATQQTHTLKVSRHLLCRHTLWHTLIPPLAQRPIKRLNPTTKLYSREQGARSKEEGAGSRDQGQYTQPKFFEAMAIHPVHFAPKRMNLFLNYNASEHLYRAVVKLHCRARIYHIQHAILARHLLQHSPIHLKRIIAHIRVIVAKLTPTPLTPRALQQHKLAWHLITYNRISLHKSINCNANTLKFILNPTNNNIRHRRAKHRLNRHLHTILKQYHHQQVVRRHHAQKRNQHKR